MTISHPLRQPGVKNKNIMDWPYTVIPSIDRDGSDDTMKAIKAIHDAMKNITDDIWNLIPGHQAPAAALPLVAPAGSLINPPGSHSALFGWPTTPITPINVLTTNDIPHGAMFRRDQVRILSNTIAMLLAPGGGNLPPIPAHVQNKIIELGERYNTLHKQRERIFQSSIKTPLERRSKWYTDSANVAEGAWMMGQLHGNLGHSTNEARAGVDKTDARSNRLEAGLLVRLNEILSKYLYAGWDAASKKLYVNLINKFANGTHAAAIIKGQALNDVTDVFLSAETTALQSGFLGVPPATTRVTRRISMIFWSTSFTRSAKLLPPARGARRSEEPDRGGRDEGNDEVVFGVSVI
jgi:hypothetical protein